MDALCRLDYQAASQYCTWKLLETTWKCFVSFWMASAIESLSLLSSLSRCNQNWTHTIMHHAFKTWCIVSTNGRYAKSPLRIGYNLSGVLFYLKRLRNPATTGLLNLLLFGVGVRILPGDAFFRPKSANQATILLFHFTPYILWYCTGTHFPTQEHTGKRNNRSLA